MPKKLDWSDRHMFVATRDRSAETLLECTAAYQRALASYSEELREAKLARAKARKAKSVPSLTTLDGQTVTKRQIKRLLAELENCPPKRGWFSTQVDVAKYQQLRSKYESALARCSNAEPVEADGVMCCGTRRTKSEIQLLLRKSYEDVSGDRSRFQSWSRFAQDGSPKKPVTILFCSAQAIRVFLKVRTKAMVAKIANAVSEEMPYLVRADWIDSSVCLFGRDVWKLNDAEEEYKPADLKLLLLDVIDRERRKLESVRRKFSGEAGRKLDPLREPIPESVRMYVWRRDEGQCVGCGSQDRLEYDHIIPVSKGGGNTSRNIQLLCEQCNRSKRDRV